MAILTATFWEKHFEVYHLSGKGSTNSLLVSGFKTHSGDLTNKPLEMENIKHTSESFHPSLEWYEG